MTNDLTDSEITEMARKSRFMRELDERDACRRLARRTPPRSPTAGGANPKTPKPNAPAGGAAVTLESHNGQ